MVCLNCYTHMYWWTRVDIRDPRLLSINWKKNFQTSYDAVLATMVWASLVTGVLAGSATTMSSGGGAGAVVGNGCWRMCS